MIELLRTRRSIRKYTEQPVEANKIEILKEAVLRSPSSKGINPWQFIFIDEKETIQKLKIAKPTGVGPLETAPLAVVFCANETVTSEQYVRNLLGIPENFRVLCAITVGHPARESKGRPFEELQFEKIKQSRF